MNDISFPDISDSDAVLLAGSLTAAACAMLDVRSFDKAKIETQCMFLEQYRFVLEKKFPEKEGTLMSRGMDLT